MGSVIESAYARNRQHFFESQKGKKMTDAQVEAINGRIGRMREAQQRNINEAHERHMNILKK